MSSFQKPASEEKSRMPVLICFDPLSIRKNFIEKLFEVGGPGVSHVGLDIGKELESLVYHEKGVIDASGFVLR